MRQLTLLQLLLVSIITLTATTYAKGHKKVDEEKNPDVLKEFRSFADSVIPEETTPFTRQIQNQKVVYVDEPDRQVTRKVSVITGETSSSDPSNAVSKTIGDSSNAPDKNRVETTGPDDSGTQKVGRKSGTVKKKYHKGTKAASKNTNVIPDASHNKKGGDTANEDTEEPSEELHNYKDDDDVDTYIDEKEEKSIKSKSTAIKKKKNPPQSKVKSGSANKVLKDHRNALKPLKHQMGGPMKVQGANHPDKEATTPSNNDKNNNKNNNNNKMISINNNKVQQTQKQQTQMQQPQMQQPQMQQPQIQTMLPPVVNTPAILLPSGDQQACIESCPATCAPSCTPQCCAMDTAPPPLKKAQQPEKEKQIRWYERPHYEPGPNVPPPVFPSRAEPVCDVSCARTCTPKCHPQCCRARPRALLPVIGCDRQCTPSICVVGCPAHCCARYVRKSNVNPGVTIIKNITPGVTIVSNVNPDVPNISI